MITNKIPLIVIGGPTATGKTGLAIRAAKLINGEIFNADSVQVYKYLNIGSNKGRLTQTGEEVIGGLKIPVFDVEDSGVRGHLFDVVEPNVNFTLSDYKKLADEAIVNIHKRGKVSILVGGTGLYIDAVIKNYDLKLIEQNQELRNILEKLSVDELQTKLKEINPTEFRNLNNSDRNNPRRLLRLIEKSMETIKPDSPSDQSIEFNTIFLYPKFDRTELYEKINQRVEQMFEEDLVEEVRSLLEKGYSLENKAMQSTGYKQVVEMLTSQKYSLQEAIDLIQTAHRQYAKRQITWFEGSGRGYELISVDESNLEKIINDFKLSF